MKSCPKCKNGALVLSEHLLADPPGSHSLAGAQMKFNARAVAVMECTACDLRVTGRLEGARYDPTIGEYTAGQFIEDVSQHDQ